MVGFRLLFFSLLQKENTLTLTLLVLAVVCGSHHGPLWALFFLLFAAAVRFLPMVALLDLIAPVIIAALQKHRRNHHGS